MNTNISKTRRGEKTLLAVAVLAAVLCAICVMAPMADADDTTETTDSTDASTTAGTYKGSELLSELDDDYVNVTVDSETGAVTISLKQDIVITSTIAVETEGQALTVNLNGCTISLSDSFTNYTGDSIKAIYVSASAGDLTIDGTVEGSGISGGTIFGGYVTSASLFIDGGTYTGDYAIIWYSGTATSAGVTATIKNATVTATEAGIWLSNKVLDSAVIENCTITATDTSTEADKGIGIYLGTVNSAEIIDCEITAGVTAVEIKCGTVVIDGCTLTSAYFITTVEASNSGSGGSCAVVTVNNNYTTEGGVEAVDVTITGSTLTSTAASAAEGSVTSVVTEVAVLCVSDETSSVAVSAEGCSVTVLNNNDDVIPSVTASLDAGQKVVVASGTTVALDVSCNGASLVGTLTAAADVTLTGGSITIDGSSTIADAVLTDDVVINSDTTLSGNVTVAGDVTVAEGATLTVGSGAAVYLLGSLSGSGSLAVEGTIYTAVEEEITVGETTVKTTALATADSEGYYECSDADLLQVYFEMYDNVKLTASGEVSDLTVPEGVTLTLAAALTVTGTLTNDGTIDASSAALTVGCDSCYIAINGIMAGGVLVHDALAGSVDVSGSIAYQFTETRQSMFTVCGIMTVTGELTIDASNASTLASDASNGNHVILSYGGSAVLNVTGTLVIVENEAVRGVLVGNVMTLNVTDGVLDIVGNGMYVNLTASNAEIGYVLNDGSLLVYSGSSIKDSTLIVDGTNATRVANGGNGAVLDVFDLLVDNSDVTVYGISGTFGDSGVVSLVNGSSLTIEADSDLNVAVDEDSTLIIGEGVIYSGEVAGYTSGSEDPTYGSVIVEEGANVSNATFAAGLDLVIEMSDVYVSGTYVQDQEFAYNQRVVVSGEFTVSTGVTVTVHGSLYVPEGSVLYVYGAVAVEGDATIEGTIEVLDGGSLTVNGDMTVSGSAGIVGTASVDGKLALTGDMTVSGTLATGADSELTVSADATLTVEGTSDGADIYSAGTVVIDSEKSTGSITVHLSSVEAAVYVVSYAGADGDALIITDDYLTTIDATAVNSNQISIEGTVYGDDSVEVVGLVVTAAWYETTGAAADYENTVYLNGQVLGTGSVVLYTDSAEVSDSLTVGAGVSLIVYDGELTVSGTVDATEYTYDSETTTYTYAQLTNNGEITVTGKISVVSGGDGVANGTINAAKYVIENTDTAALSVNVYTTLAQAVEDGATDITLVGEYTVDEIVEIPEGTTVTVDESAVVTVDGGEITVKDGASLVVDGTITVKDGYVYAEDAADITVGDNGAIVSDIVVEGEDGDVMYTDLAYALENAEDGDTIALAKDVTLSKDTTIPEGVTLDTNGYSITLLAGVTLTVDGELYIGENGSVVLTPATESKAAAAIVVNGDIQSVSPITEVITDGTTTGEYLVDGAYASAQYEGDTYYLVMTVEDALAQIKYLDNETVEIRGDFELGDVEVAGSTGASVYVYGTVSASSVTLDEAVLVVDDGSFAGTVMNDAGYVTISVAGSSTYVFAVDESAGVLTVAGEAYGLTVDGAVTFDGVDAVSVTVEGDLTVAGDCTFGSLVVDGTMTVSKGFTVYVTNDTTVYGTVTGDGALDTSYLYIGMSANDCAEYIDASYTPSTGASAVVDVASLALGEYAVAASGCSITYGNIVGTEYTVGNSVWLSVYAESGTSYYIGMVSAPDVGDGLFQYWADTKTDAKATDAAIGDCETVYAYVLYDIYSITIRADVGVANIYLNGILMENTSGNVYTVTGLTAGTYTVSFSLAAGYVDAGVKLSDSTGAAMSSFDIVLSGTDNLDVVCYLTGVEAASEAEVESDDGMSLTDILLIIIVILILVMCIIVALRLFRS